MSRPDRTIVLASRSPRRRALLESLVGPDRVVVLPPSSPHEPGFDDCADWSAIEARLLAISRAKCDDVMSRLVATPNEKIAAVVAADTIVVVGSPPDLLRVLGQPPDDDAWPDTVRTWFRDEYFGKSHVTATALVIATPFGKHKSCVVKSTVAFREDGEKWLDWYIGTGEPRGKAGGYAIQELGSVFVTRVDGSYSNIVGLPLEAVIELFEELGIDVDRAA